MNQVSMVGERGPELFVPDTPGTIYSNEDTKAMMEQYSLANSDPDSSAHSTTFQMDTTIINGVEYATVEQVQKMGRAAAVDGAKQGEARAMNRLRQSRSTRQKVGI